MEIKIKLHYLILIILILMITSFFIGRSIIKMGQTIDYNKLPERPLTPPNIDNINVIEIMPDTNILVLPPNIIKPKDKINIKITPDTNTLILQPNIIKKSIIPHDVDIDSLYADYIKIRRSTNVVMYDNKYGKFTISYDIQFNRMNRIYDVKLQPIEKVITNTIEKSYTPFIIGGYNTNNFLNAGVGIIFNKSKFGIQYNYQHDLKRDNILNRSGHTINFIKTF